MSLHIDGGGGGANGESDIGGTAQSIIILYIMTSNITILLNGCNINLAI